MNWEHTKIYLRPWTEADAKDLHTLAQNERVASLAGWPTHRSVEESRFWIQELFSCWGFYAIIEKETNVLIGNIQLLIGEASNYDIEDNEGELGFWIGEDYWGKGYTKQAIELMLAYAFDELELDAVWCGYSEDNLQSKKLQAKCGFIYQYRLEHAMNLRGEDHTEIVQAIVREDYPIK